MRAMTVRNPASIATLTAAERPDVGAPQPGEIVVRLRAGSLNFHDYLVVNGSIPSPMVASLCRMVPATLWRWATA